MIPRLQRFYGGSPERWHQMPTWLFTVYAKMRPRLEAEEQLDALAVFQVAGGRQVDNKTYDEFRTGLIEKAKAATTKPYRPKSLEEMASLGVPVTVVERV